MLGARKKAEDIGFMRPGEQPYFYAGAPVLALGYAEEPRRDRDAASPNAILAGQLEKAYVVGEDVLLSGPMGRTVQSSGVRAIDNLHGLICGLNAFALRRDSKDEHGCVLYLLVNDMTGRDAEVSICLTSLIFSAPPANEIERKSYEDNIEAAVMIQCISNSAYIETARIWTR